MFYIGQKVVCVNDRFSLVTYERAHHIPRKGFVYTVCEKDICSHVVTGRKELAIQLCELRNPVDERTGAIWFSGWRFRPWDVEDANLKNCMVAKEKADRL